MDEDMKVHYTKDAQLIEDDYDTPQVFACSSTTHQSGNEPGPSSDVKLESEEVQVLDIKADPAPDTDIPDFVRADALQVSQLKKCPVCPYTAKAFKYLAKHMALHEEEDENPDSVQTCSICSYKTKDNCHMELHIRTHSGEKPFQCDMCTFKSAERGVLNSHFARKHTNRRPFKCSFCDFRAIGVSFLNQHVKERHAPGRAGAPTLTCHICQYKTKKHALFAKHMLIHERGKSKEVFSCYICNYKTDKKDRVDDHIMTHTGEKPLSCNICGYSCIQKSALSMHMKRHVTERAFSCNLCDYKAKVQSDVNSHVKQMHGSGTCRKVVLTIGRAKEENVFQCGLCPYKGKTEIALKHHIEMSMGDNQYACMACCHSFQRQCDFTTHLRLHPEIKLHCMLCSYSTFFQPEYDEHFNTHME